jgi:hypothetical protein
LELEIECVVFVSRARRDFAGVFVMCLVGLEAHQGFFTRKYTFRLIVIVENDFYNPNMASQESIRLLCIGALRAEGADFEMQLLELFSELKDHFDTPHSDAPIAELVQSALHRPPDA